MLRIFLGKDAFSKEQQLKQLATEVKAEIRRITTEDTMLTIEQLNDAPLFGPRQLFVFDNSIAKTKFIDDLAALANVSNEIVIIENDSPKRGSTLATTFKDIAKVKNVSVINFEPMGLSEAASWLKKQAATYGATFAPDGVNALLSALVPEPATSWETPEVNLHLLNNELEKLATYSDGAPITAATVAALTNKSSSSEVWGVINAIADKNGKKVFTSLEKFMADTDGGDDKAKMILLNALLADQFRNILIMQDSAQRNVPDQVILGQTGWKSGRLYQFKKLAAKFTGTQVRQLLSRLENLDIELKTSSTPPRPIMDLILTQIL